MAGIPLIGSVGRDIDKGVVQVEPHPAVYIAKAILVYSRDLHDGAAQHCEEGEETSEARHHEYKVWPALLDG